MPILVGLGLTLFVYLHTSMVEVVTVRFCKRADAERGRQEALPVFLAPPAFDGYMWNVHAEALGGENGLRLRRTSFDNYPDGRAVHWNSAFAWFLRGLGEARRAMDGGELRPALFLGSLWAAPIIAVTGLWVLLIICSRRYGGLMAAILGVSLLLLPGASEGFAPANPDHHGLISLLALGVVLGICRPGAASMIWSGFFNGALFWTSALTGSILALAIGLAAILTTHASRMEIWRPADWVRWGCSSAGFSLLFFLLEKAPDALGDLRLEVNHPLYALALLGGGLGLSVLATRRRPSPGSVTRLGAGGVLLAPLPVTIWFFPASYLASDPLLTALYDYIAELEPLWSFFPLKGVVVLCLPVSLAAWLLVGMLVRRDGLPKPERLLLAFTALVTVFLSIPALFQVRWWAVSVPLLTLPIAWGLSLAWKADRRPLWLWLVLGVLGGSILYTTHLQLHSVVPQYFAGWRATPTAEQLNGMLHREIAAAVQRKESQPSVILSSPNSSIIIAAMAGEKTIGTLYWENIEGLRKAFHIFNATTVEEGSRLLDQIGVSHVVLMGWQPFIQESGEILKRLGSIAQPPDVAFALMLLEGRRSPPGFYPQPFFDTIVGHRLRQSLVILRREAE
ncbi:MAG: hypothetical protein SNJ52_01170 [Verrucomicrobiia bacterium]